VNDDDDDRMTRMRISQAHLLGIARAATAARRVLDDMHREELSAMVHPADIELRTHRAKVLADAHRRVCEALEVETRAARDERGA
jgi:hypothetical protein